MRAPENFAPRVYSMIQSTENLSRSVVPQKIYEIFLSGTFRGKLS